MHSFHSVVQDIMTPDVLNHVTYEAHENANLKAKNGEIYRTCILWNLKNMDARIFFFCS